jgi:pantothenate kinase type III
MARRTRSTGSSAGVIATGGLAETFRPFCDFDLVDPHLTLRGLQIAYELLAEPGR